MKTLLLRLEGPMQSWGTSSRFTERDTRMEPSKSGVIGLLCAALGKPRHEVAGDTRWPPLATLAALRMGVRIDRPGKVGVDFQTAGGGDLGHREYGVAKADGGRPESVMSWRYYLQDASFLVGLESEDEGLLSRLQSALREPMWPLYLGRKSYVPARPVYLPNGLYEGNLRDAFRNYDPPAATGDMADQVWLVLDDPSGSGTEIREDVPLDFARRRFGVRRVLVRPLELSSTTRA
ncbi:MAG: type I-E CRISPR-associated protein Cas5/CasD [Chitinophagales bacterium]